MVVERDEHGFDAPVPLGHPARASMPTDRALGPSLGSRLPDFHLPDAFGRLMRFHEDRGQAPAVIVFFRSAVW